MKTQAFGWLAAAVIAAALNASYHQGGMEWAHRIADRIAHNTEAVLALATGNADRFLAEAQAVKAENFAADNLVADDVTQTEDEVSTCRFHQALARVQSKLAHSQARFDRLNAAMAARQEQEHARMEAQAARIEAHRARLEAEFANIRIPAVAFNRVVVSTPKVDVCPRIRVNVPQIPAIKVPSVPVVHIDVGEAGTI